MRPTGSQLAVKIAQDMSVWDDVIKVKKQKKKITDLLTHLHRNCLEV